MNRRTRSAQRPRNRRGQIAVGLVGAGSMWERRYKAAVGRLSDRLAVRVVYDAVLAKAQLVAAELRAEAVSGLRQLFERSDLQAILVLDPAWYDLYPAELACEYHKPVFLAGSLGDNRVALESLHECAIENETLLMTEFSRRYTPATNRLRELIATRLGAARQVSVDALVPLPQAHGPLPGQASERDYLAGLMDWCHYITGRVPTSLSAGPVAGSEQGSPDWKISLGFRPDANGKPATSALLTLRPSRGSSPESSTTDSEEWPFPRHEVVCDHGRAIISAASEIGWQNGTQELIGPEHLTAERSDAEVMLDQFTRRILGGLVPVADLHDVCRALRLVEVAETCRQGGQSEALVWS